MMKYLPRLIDKDIEKYLSLSGAILVTGMKWCGKTTSARQFAKSEIALDDNESGKDLRALLNVNASAVLNKEAPLLIDEWQLEPSVWNKVRREVDTRGKKGQFILTGSSTPLTDEDREQIEHSGFGRIYPLTMRTMSSFESGFSYGKVSISTLLNGKGVYISETSDRTLEDTAFALCKGGWPASVFDSDENALEIPWMLFNEIIYNEIFGVRWGKKAGLRKNPEEIRRLLLSYARNISTQASVSLIRRDLSQNENILFNEETLWNYLNRLREMYIIEDLDAWSPNTRSKARVQSAPTRHLADPSIAVAALNLSPSALLEDLKTFGLLFESFVVRDLRVYAAALNGKLYHFRNDKGLEADAVMELRDHRSILFEVKLFDQSRIDEGAANLLKIQNLIDEERMKKPELLIVVTAGKSARLRPDGVYEIPISLLRP